MKLVPIIEIGTIYRYYLYGTYWYHQARVMLRPLYHVFKRRVEGNCSGQVSNFKLCRFATQEAVQQS
jgi:hypothetical protein